MSSETHESYGMVGFSRTSCRPGVNLFGSAIKHANIITLRIKQAKKERSLNEDRYYGGESLIEVAMSQNQFAEAITAMNVGDGVPCTIRRIGKTGVADCPEETVRQVFEQEFKQHCAEIVEAAAGLVSKAGKILEQKTVKKSELKELISVLRKLSIELNCNLPFVGSQFNDAMDKIVTDGKNTVEAYILHRLTELGTKALSKEIDDSNELPAITFQSTLG